MSDRPWHELDPAERRRTYLYGDGFRIDYTDVYRVAVSQSGHHYLETTDGLKHVVAPGWRAIELDMDGWTF